MTIHPQPILDDSEWDVPAHEAAIYAPRRHAHALVIPVINEEERIRGQLRRIQAAGLPVDVIVADGGSTDGSLDAGFVAQAGVRAVLTKTGPGKLSAQLRMAYAWCLRQGYAGIVTIDGNGKDGVEAVAAMVAKLEEGCDYVQGSRYLPGGAAENTPLERTIANRLVHAPLLSLAGRDWFTDTTNGFRAYSAAYLTHPDVRPFRAEFSVYNLLFYLTVRAGQLGLKVAQVPVVRRYPDDGKVPTKIGGFAPKLALLKETVTAATGGYTPDDAARGRASRMWPLLALLMLVPLLMSVIASPPFSPDSWALYELSQTVFSDFYRFNHWRSYTSALPYSASFPPLYPTLLAIADALLGTGPRTGVYLAFACFAAFAVVSEQIGRTVTGAAWIGLGAALIGLLGPNMLLAELGAGRTIPLQLLLFALILNGMLRGAAIGLAGAAGIGFVAGLAVLNRFDAVLLPLLIAAMIAWLTRKPSHVLAALAAAAVATLPWVIYSLTTFGTVFATDNGGIATTLDPAGYVTDWWPAPQPGLADDPAAWAARVLGNALGYVATALSLLPTGMALVAAAFLVPPALVAVLSGPRRRGDERPAVLAGFAAITALLLAPQVLTGFLEHRYFAAFIWAGLLAAGCWCIARGATLHQRALAARLAFTSVAAAMAVLTIAQVTEALGSGRIDRAAWARFDAPGDLKALQMCVKDTPRPRILVLGDNLFAARAGALGGFATMMEPRNMARGRLGTDGSRAFIAEWQVDYVLPRDPARARWAASNLDVVEIKGCPFTLYRVVR
ncbi:MAG: glycosyltransferase family 2 protein [Erythrobacteraceae bacterium]|jgi:hypothetical protein|nr:glycosyltransferase family 2 protein [Erythrobacteraceae bacterium]